MYAAADVHYLPSGGARAALVLAPDPTFSAIVSEKTVFIDHVAPYQPGEFYRRELPPIRAVLADVDDLGLLIIDGYVTLDPDGRPGLGAYAHEEFAVSVIGVAKTRYALAVHAIPVVRGTAKRPLYVTAVGIPPADAAELVRTMTGSFRLPDALRRVDALARGTALVCIDPLGGGPQFGGSVVGERLAMAEARDGGVEAGQPAKRGGCLGAVDVEYAADDRAVRAAGCWVAGEQHLVPGEVERDAPRRVAGNGHRHGAVAEAELVAVLDLAVDPRRRHRLRREPAHDLVVEGPFPVGQVRCRPGRPGADERRVGAVGEHLHVALAGDVGRGPDVIGVEVRQHQPPQVGGLVSALPDRVGDQRRGPGKAGVDEGEPVGIVPQVGVPGRKADEAQARQELDDVHAATVTGGS